MAATAVKAGGLNNENRRRGAVRSAVSAHVENVGSIEEVAQVLEVTTAVVEDWLYGRAQPTDEQLTKLRSVSELARAERKAGRRTVVLAAKPWREEVKTRQLQVQRDKLATLKNAVAEAADAKVKRGYTSNTDLKLLLQEISSKLDQIVALMKPVDANTGPE